MKRVYLILLIIAILAVVATMTRSSPVRAISANIVSTFVESPLPVDDANAVLWKRSMPTEVPMSAQTNTQPMSLNPAIRSMNIRSLNNGEQIAFLLEWNDKAKDVGGGVSGFRDSVALQFPVKSDDIVGDFICMGIGLKGEETALIDILHWRADFQRDIKEGYADIKHIFPNMAVNFYPEPDLVMFRTAEAAGNPLARRERSTPIEDVSAEGYGTLESQESMEALGWGEWENGQWQVIIARPLKSADPSNAQLQLGQLTTIALATWDGANQEVNGNKSVSSWLSLGIEGVRTDISLYRTILPIAITATVILLAILLLRRILLASRRQHK